MVVLLKLLPNQAISMQNSKHFRIILRFKDNEKKKGKIEMKTN